MIDDKLSWNLYVEDLLKKLNQRMYFLRKLRSFNVDKSILKIFYISAIQSKITFGITCYGCGLSKSLVNMIDRVIKKCSKIISSELPFFNDLCDNAVLKKASNILKDPTHPLHQEYERSGRSGRLISKKSRTERYKNTFIPFSTRLLQSLKK